MTIVHQDFPSHLGIKIAQFIFLTTIIATVSDTLLWSIDITGQLKVCWNPIVDSGRNEKVTFFESVSTLDKLSDLSGPNAGLNTGRAILHSGTVGAALTAQNFGLSALAVSAQGDGSSPWHWDTAVAIAAEVIDLVLAAPPRSVVNLKIGRAHV